jgi:A/G-specific adenine glycosylase
MHPFSKTILDWYACYGRDLPWRRTQDPYAVWLSEIILQQTRIVQGMEYWKRFLTRFPTVQDLAAASEDEVMRLWEGLGYYSRARNLHAAAKQIVALGAFPTTLEGISSLKGVGDYTAAAIGSICFGLPAAVVDGNVYRVLARYFGLETPVGTTAAKKEFTALAQRLLPPQEASAFNQGMMDFGALQCTPQKPDCLTCPLQSSCHAYRTGRQALLPVKKAATKVQERHLNYVYVRFNGETAIRKRPAGDIWQGLYEPLVTETANQTSSEKWFFAKPCEKYFSEDDLHLLRKGVKHQLTHRTILADFYLWEPAERPQLPEDYIWIQETELDRYGKPRLFEKLLEIVGPSRQ